MHQKAQFQQVQTHQGKRVSSIGCCLLSLYIWLDELTFVYNVVCIILCIHDRSERQETNVTVDTTTTNDTAKVSVESRVIANSDDLFRKYDGLHDILANNDNLRLKVSTPNSNSSVSL
jgi:hypothetical protein